MLDHKSGLKAAVAAAIILLGVPFASFAKVSGPVAGQAAVKAFATPASVPNDRYYRAKVVKVLKEGVAVSDGQTQPWQDLQLELMSGEQKGALVSVNNGLGVVDGSFQKFALGDQVVVDESYDPSVQTAAYYIVDRYRIPNLMIAALAFLALAVYFGRRRGLTSVVGMVFSILVVFFYVMPAIGKGGDPFAIAVTGAATIIAVSLYLSHGFNKRTTIALASALLSLALAVIIDLAFAHFAKLTGSGTEDASTLQFGGVQNISLFSIYLGGIIIGVVGVLDDVTIGQSSAIEELHAANATLDFAGLVKSGRSIGQEHIASMINTLVLAYVGVSFPLLLLYSLQRTQPIWVILNGDFIAEEIIRTLVGSSVLVIAVPLTTFLAAYFYSRNVRNDDVFNAP
jgi:uncharacterized membrane protein